jgi:hypothetical protein
VARGAGRSTLVTNNSRPEIDHALPSVTVDAFLWDHTVAPAQAPFRRPIARPEERLGEVIDVTAVPVNPHLVPAGMFDQWPLEVFLHITKPFTGLVVLIDLTTNRRHPAHTEGLLQSVTGFVAGLLGENDFGCRTPEDEFVMIFAGLEGAAAQRRLNRLSEQFWEFQQRGRGAFSILFSWGGIGTTERPLSDAFASAVHRMNRINQNRNINSKESVNHHRKVV